jgi:Skp family chaperone for outer membrane proteins
MEPRTASKQSPSNTWPRLVTTALLALTLYAGAAIAQSPGAKAPTFKVGIVDLGEIFNGYKRKISLEKEINVLKEQLDAAIRKQSKLLNSLDKEAEELTGSKSKAMEDRIKLEVYRRRILKENRDGQLRQQLENMTLTLLEDINEVIGNYGKDFGYTMILKVDKQGFGKDEFREKIFRAQVQSVLYYNDGTDITKPVLVLLNKKK